jgi:polysaccharide biosynthesis/export protein
MKSALNKIVQGLAILGMVSFVAGCASDGPKTTTRVEDVVQMESGRKQQVAQRNEERVASIKSVPQPVSATIGEGDLLSINIFEAPELLTEARVDNQGDVTLPLVGTMTLKGLTIAQAEKKIAEAYRRKYLQNPHVSIFVKEYQSGKITLLGAVTKPGTYDYLSRQRVLDVLALAGGLTDKAAPGIEVRRAIDTPGDPTVLFIDLDEITKRGRSDLNIEVQRGDVIFVPEASIVYVDGAVHNSGIFPIRRNMSVQEAITAAGGFSPVADPNRIKVIRNVEDGKKEVIQVSMSDIANGDSSYSLRVKDQDTIFVETNGMRAFFFGLHIMAPLGGGFGYSPPAR